MSKYMDTFADAAVSSSSMTDTMTAPQGAVGTKKKVKIDASLLQNLEVTSFMTGLSNNDSDSQKKSDCCQPTQEKSNCCHTPQIPCEGTKHLCTPPAQCA